MFGKLLGKVASTVVRTANLPAEALDRVGDYMLNEEDSPDPSGPRMGSAGRWLAEEVQELLEGVDE